MIDLIKKRDMENKMKLVKLDINRHDLNEVSGLIYETDTEMYNFFFNRKENAVKIIKKLLKEGNNSLGHEHTYIITEDNRVLGLLVYSIGNETSRKEDYRAFFKVLNPWDALKFTIFDILDGLILSDLRENDYYLACVAVNENFRGRGIGTFILEKAKELASEEGCARIVLDVDLENEGALRLYEKSGFKTFNKKSIRWFNGEKGTFNMEYLI